MSKKAKDRHNKAVNIYKNQVTLILPKLQDKKYSIHNKIESRYELSAAGGISSIGPSRLFCEDPQQSLLAIKNNRSTMKMKKVNKFGNY